ncbi:hypothetical protein lbkm_1083 [Lachnospiraceae bacterium KM106-2]|nr:hypothetical protein lbkm_1083 [Lachnospiraceae bacterium KM106-2]
MSKMVVQFQALLLNMEYVQQPLQIWFVLTVKNVKKMMP